MENFVPTSQGPAYFRSGTAYVADARVTTGDAPLLLPFKFSDALSYILEFSALKLRIFNSSGLIVSGALTVTALSEVAAKYGFYNVTFTVGSGHGISTGQSVLLDGYEELGLPELDGYWTVGTTTSTTIKINNIPDGLGGITSGGTVTPELTIVTPYAEGDFRNIQVAQANDVMYVVHPGYPPRKLVRSSDTSWSFSTYSRTNDPFSTTNLYPSCVCFHQQSVVMGGSNSYPLRWYKSVPGNFADFTVSTPIVATDATDYTLSAQTYSSIRSIQSVDGALIFTCSDKIRRIAGVISPTSAPDVQDVDTDGAAQVTPAANDRALISVTKDLRRVKSIAYDYNAQGGVSTEITKAADHLTYGGITQLCFQTFFNNTNWALKANGELVGLNQDVQEQVMGWYRHTTRQGDLILSIAPKSVDGGFDELWMIVERSINGERIKYIEKMVLDYDLLGREDFYTGDETQDNLEYDNYLFEQQKQKIHLDCSLSYDGSEQSPSLTLDNLGGTLVTATASAALFVSTDVGREIWAKDGEGKFIIDTYISSTVVSGHTTKSFGTLSFAAGEYYLTAVTVTGLGHLEGESVAAVADGSPNYDITVSAGQITLSKQASVIHVGLPYIGWIKTHNLAPSGAEGNKKNVSKAMVRFQNTMGASVGTSRYDMEKITFRKVKHIFGRPPALFTGYKDVNFNDSTSEDKSVYIKQDVPAPCTVQLIKPYLTVGEA